MRPSFYTLAFGVAVLIAGSIWPQMGKADDKLYVCAVSEARECTSSAACEVVKLEEIFLAPLVILDLENKVIVSAAMDDYGRKEAIAGILRTPSELIVYGHGDDEVWSTIISLKNGKMTGNINSGETAHILYGHCAPYTYPR